MSENKLVFFDYLKTILVVSPFFVFFGYFILWSYLDSIGWLSLFPSIVDGESTLLILMVSFSFLSLTVIFIFFLPSLVLFQMGFFTLRDELSRVINLEKVPYVSCIASVIVLIVIFCFSFFDFYSKFIKDNVFYLLLFSLVPFVFSMVHLISKKRRKVHLFYKNGKLVEKRFFLWEKVIITFFIVISGLTITIPLLFIMNLSSAYSIDGLINLFILSVVIVLVSFFPSMLFYSGEKFKFDFKSKCFTVMMPIFSIFIISMIMLPNFSFIVERGAFKYVGMIDDSYHIYSLRKISYTSDMFPVTIWKYVDDTKDKYLFVKATVLLSIGKKVIICPDFVARARSRYIKYNLDNMFSRGESVYSKYLKEITKSCVLVDGADIKQWDAISDGSNLLN